MKRITSRHHPLVAACRALAAGRAAHGGRMLLDGHHLIQDAVRAGCAIEIVAIDTATADTEEGRTLVDLLERAAVEVVETSAGVLEAMSPVRSPAGVVAIARRPAESLEAVVARRPQLLVLGVNIQDPGNAGALARAAEAGGATGVALCDASADPFGWKALRGSMGSLLRLPVASGLAWPVVVEAVRRAGATVVATGPRGGVPLYQIDLRRPVAFLLGAEGAGLPDAAADAADVLVSIPMEPPVESLNVAVAGALLVYEAARQRRRTPGVS